RYASGNWQGGKWAGGNWQGGRWNGRWNGGRWHNGRWWPWAVAGVGIGLAAWPYYGGGYYCDEYDPYCGGGYYGGDAYYGGAGYVESGYGDDGVAYCARRFRTYDMASGTYVGKGGRRIPCP